MPLSKPEPAAGKPPEIASSVIALRRWDGNQREEYPISRHPYIETVEQAKPDRPMLSLAALNAVVTNGMQYARWSVT